ncbi:hypothetical protein EJB05_39413 [Eragrostis curvula]|uniref:BRX domain-containing protein n=1 Tax=Eragrostis curvula TaxID=38414 RepID=A0A5J9TYT8_9POAL|nr:hypothetical protein EJB05_39413 [Eragrostis curvula]
MLACIACSSKEGGEDGSRAAATPHGKDAVKSLTSQIKDMVLKFSGSNKQYKAASPAFVNKNYRHRYPGFIDDTGFAPASRVHGEEYYTRTSALAATGAAGSNRDWQLLGGKGPGGGGSSVEEGAAGDEIVAVEEPAVSREWTAQVEPGVQITFVTLPGGGNDLKRIRFSREMFNKWEAQRWWGENYDRIVELYNVLTFSGRQQGASTPASSVDDSVMRDSSFSRGGSTTRNSPVVTLPPPPTASKEPVPQITPCKEMPGLSSSSAPYAAALSSTRAAYYPSTAVPDPSDHVWAHHFNMLNNAEAGSSAMGGGPSSYDPRGAPPRPGTRPPCPSATRATWKRQSGSRRTSRACASPSVSWATAPASSAASASAGKGSARRGRRSGGSRTGTEYRRSTCKELPRSS